MSGAPTGPNQSFQERLGRVAEQRAPFEELEPVSVLPDIKSRFSGKFGLFAAVFIGLLAVVIVRIARFHFTGEAMIGGQNADLTLAIETGAALAVSFLIFALLPFKGVQFKFAQFGGVIVMISMMHNVVHQAPAVFSAMFSPEWTAAVTEQTEPNSLYLRGEVIPFVKEEKKLPSVRRG